MPVKGKRWARLALVALAMPLPVLHGQQQVEKPRMVAATTASEPFWVKRETGSLSAGRSHGKERPKPGTNKAGGGISTTATVANKVSGSKSDSIAGALEGSRSVPWSIVLGLTLLTLLPALLLSMTPLVRLLVVFHFLRQALGTQTAPSNQVLMGLALMMTWFLMQPVLQEVEQKAVAPYSAGTISGSEAMDRGVEPVKRYMLRYAREKDLTVFAAAGMGVRPESKEALPIQVVVPAYILSELKAGFQIGAVLFLPFMLVDLVVASVTTSIGMMQLPPVVISTPLKILLFVMVDGWNLLADQLIKSF
ncbi:MAG: flagellar biosynthetic protein FliP [Edaphobacter sp.]|nr:flagellar biosynthetic protein FliP [Edaphobacter sp.]